MTPTPPVILPVREAALMVAPDPPVFEREGAAQIDRFWADAVASNPTLFDGRVHLAAEWDVAEGRLTATCHPARFATLLYWRSLGYPPIGLSNAFGGAVLVSSDRALLLGRMAVHTTNSEMVYFPGGGFDGSDVADDCIDVAGAIARECIEETGLAPDLARARPGFWVTVTRSALAITRLLDLPWDASSARRRILENVAAMTEPELTDILILRNEGDADGLPLPDHCRQALPHLFRVLEGAT